MHRDIIEHVPFLQDKDELFVSYTVPLMKAMKFQQGEYIYRQGSPIDEIFFVVEGLFGFVLNDFEEIVYVNIHPGDYFGDIDYVHKDNDGKR